MKNKMHVSLQTRFILIYLAIILVLVGGFAGLVNWQINTRFNKMISAGAERFGQRSLPFFSAYYRENGSWVGVDEFIQTLPERGTTNKKTEAMPSVGYGEGHFFPIMPGDERLLLLDANNEIIFDSKPNEEPISNLSKLSKNGNVIMVDDKQVGTLVIASSMGFFNDLQNRFINQVNMVMGAAATLAVILVVVIGIWQARSILNPVNALVVASRQLAAGDYSREVPNSSHDELGEMANAFNSMSKELQKQHKLRRRLTADIAHELRTPLSVLQIELESLEDGLIEASPETVHGLQDEVAYLSKLVDDLRILSLADSGELSIETSPVDLIALLQQLATRISLKAQQSGIDIALELSEQPIVINSDEQRLTQILLNLLANALEHTPAGGNVTLGARKDDGKVLIWIRDTGEGIAAEHLPYIFERLYRSDQARVRVSSGSGLGLSIARSLMERLGGKITADSNGKDGSTFTAILPE